MILSHLERFAGIETLGRETKNITGELNIMPRTKTAKKKTTKRVVKKTEGTTKRKRKGDSLDVLQQKGNPAGETGTGRETAQAVGSTREVDTSRYRTRFERSRIQFQTLVREKEGQITLSEYQKMPASERLALWKQLNEGETMYFISVVKPSESRTTRIMTKAEAVTRGLIAEKKPKDMLYCPYCATWSTFKRFSYLESTKCIGCGISVNDFHVKTQNGLWGATK